VITILFQVWRFVLGLIMISSLLWVPREFEFVCYGGCQGGNNIMIWKLVLPSSKALQFGGGGLHHSFVCSGVILLSDWLFCD